MTAGVGLSQGAICMAFPICNRERWSSMIFWLPGTWRDRNNILYFKHACTNFLTSFMIARFLDVDLFMISTTPEFSVMKMILWFARNLPNNSVTRTKGYSSSKVMSAEVKGLCHVPATHFFPKNSCKTYVARSICVQLIRF